MQTTLLGLAIAVILALLAALIGPFFVDWNAYRAQFETEASRLVGLPVRVSGPIDVRLLPTPTLRLNGVRIGRPDEEPIRANALGIEMALGPLVRGQLRASEMLVSGPQLTIAIGRDGRAELPAGTLGFDTQNLAIDQLTIEEARVILIQAASDRRFVFEKLWFKGEARSLAGTFRGEGAFIHGKDLFGYRIGATRQDTGGIKTRFTLDSSDRALTVEGEGLLASDKGVPHFEGTLSALRPVGTVLSSGRAVVNEPWRVTSRVKAGPDSALFENIEFQYGPDDRALKVTGTAALKYEADVRLDGVLSASQLDIDRLMAKEAQAPSTPFAALREFAERFGRVLHPPFPVQFGISVETLTIGGGTVQALRGDLRSTGDEWLLDGFELRAPGATQVHLSGRASLSDAGPAFSGPAELSSADPRQLIAWLEGRDAAVLEGLVRPLRLRGDISLGGERIAIERLRADIDRKAVEGRLAYVWPSQARKARLDAQLKAEELDIDGLVDLGRAAFANSRFERPGEISLAVDIARARLGGVTARNANAKLTFDGSGLTVERFGLGDLGGVALKASGRIDTTSAAPKGELTVDFDGRDLAGMSSLIARYAPDGAQPLRSVLDRLGSATLRATLAVSDTGGDKLAARLSVDGQSGGLRLALKSSLTGAMADIAAGAFRLEADVNAADGARLLRVAGLDGSERAVAGPGRLTLRADGPLGSDMHVSAAIASPALTAQADGTMRAMLSSDASGTFDLNVTKVHLAALLQPLRSRNLAAVPATFASRVSLSGTTISFEKIAARIANTAVSGQIAVDRGEKKVNGSLSADAADGAAIVIALSGMPPSRADGAGWPMEPFIRNDWPELTGQIDLRGARVTFGPSLAIKDMSTQLHLSPDAWSFEKMSGELEGGRATGEFALRKIADGLNVKGRATVEGADAAALIAAEGRPVSGRLGFRMDFEGTGLSPKALVGSLNGSGTVSIERVRLASLDPRVFAAAMRAADHGVGLEPARVGPVVTQALDAGPLAIANAEGALAMAGGQIRLSTMIARAEGAELAVSGSLDLASGRLDTRLVLAGADAGHGAGRPEIAVTLRGDPFAPQRTIDVSALSGWLALRAVEQQSRKLEAIERARASSPPPAVLPPSATVPAPTTPQHDPTIALPRPRSAVPPAARESYAEPRERAAPLPPPLVIAPVPGSRIPQAPARPQATNPPPVGRTF